jgi:hypothetical protein
MRRDKNGNNYHKMPCYIKKKKNNSIMIKKAKLNDQKSKIK